MGESTKETFCHVFRLCPSALDLLTNSGVWPGASGFYTGSRANGRVQTSKLQIRVFFATLCGAHNGSASVEEQILVLRVAESSKSHNSKADEEDYEDKEEEEEEELEAEEE